MIWFDTDEFKEKAKRLITIIENTNLEQAFVLHHTDNDGFGSAAVIHHFLPNIPLRNYIPCNYGDNTDLLDEKVAAAGIANTHVFFCVDYTPDEELIREYSEQGYIWVFMDHHQTAIEKLANLNFNGLDFCKSQMDDAEKIIPEDYQQGKLVRQFSATELIYHIFIRLELPGLNVVRYKGMIPEVISCIGRYDVWDLNANPKVKLFKAATCNLDVNDWFKDIVHIPETLNLPSLQKIEAYSKLLSIKYKNVFDNLIEMGKLVDKVLTAQLRNLARKIGVFTTDIQLSEYDPIYVCVINARTNSAVFEHCVFKKSLQGVNVIFNHDVVTRTYTVSFYSRANNCKNGYALQYLKALVTSYTAQGKKVISYGGHPNACGAVVEDITAFLFNHLTVVDMADLCK